VVVVVVAVDEDDVAQELELTKRKGGDGEVGEDG
jgi:hypothetical protein